MHEAFLEGKEYWYKTYEVLTFNKDIYSIEFSAETTAQFTKGTTTKSSTHSVSVEVAPPAHSCISTGTSKAHPHSTPQPAPAAMVE
ncbi:natterin-3-like isoform X1 [Lates japonicus]|uniref:Natterin-3-like isoform X1 n=1 Tax=Lates japonicus TaxID=270547 RepID=A0AAD3RA71_LATJO|nr:natterin-3-like isoform X1 [Lates japonicus]